MKKYIIKQIPPEQAELMYYFENDGITEKAGGIEYALFPLFADRWSMTPGINKKLWEDITREAESVSEGFDDVKNGATWNDWTSYKEVMTWHGIKYSPTACHRLKEWNEAHEADPTSTEAIAEYLTITTGRPWDVTTASGYSQGDYAEIVYCKDIYTQQDAEAAGEIGLGAANEYSITDLDDNGNELDTVYGYIVADCQAWRPEDVKRLICEWEGIDPAEAVLMTIEDSYTRTEYVYTEAC